MSELAIIGGTGLTTLKGFEITRREVVDTPYGEPSGPLTYGTLAGKEIIFLARHGERHTIPPHKINYRANIWALHQTGVKRVIAVAAVGGIRADMRPERLVIPDQIIDYTWGRGHTFFEEDLTEVTHIDFTCPYNQALRELLIKGCRSVVPDACEEGTYGAVQGPRLETAAEINRMEKDTCTIVGMTGMPEAALARELALDYAACAVVANWAAGRGGAGTITMEEIQHHLKSGMDKVRLLLEHITPSI